MKRLFSVLACFGILLACLIPCASAAGSDWVNVFDYASANGSGSNYFQFSNSTTVVYDTGIGSLVRRVDILINSAGADITSASLNGTGLYVLPLDDSVFRIYGSVSNITTGKFSLTLKASGTAYCEIISFKVSGLYYVTYPITGQISVDWAPGSSTGFVAMPDANTTAEVFWGGGSATDSVSSFSAWVYPNSWKEYDYIDFSFFIRAQSIDSLTVTHNGNYVPFDISYLDTVSQTWYDPNNSSPEFNFVDLTEVYISLRIDVSGLDKGSSSLPRIGITGQYRNDNRNNRLALYDVVGHVNADSENPIIHWLKKIYSALIGEGSGAGEAGSTIESQAGELEGIGDALGDVTKPDIDDLDGSLDDLVSPEQVDAVGAVFSPLFQNNTILHILIMSLTLALVSYVLYGKR